jgi:hypothetical protein
MEKNDTRMKCVCFVSGMCSDKTFFEERVHSISTRW